MVEPLSAEQRPGPRIVIVGAAGFTNLGDDAILAAMVAELRAAIPGARFAVATGGGDERGERREERGRTGVAEPLGSPPGPILSSLFSPLSSQADVTALPFDDGAVAAALAGADLLIVGGGGFIYDYDARISAYNFLHGDSSLFYPHYRAVLTAHSLGVPIHVYGVGVGPLLTAPGRGLTRTILGLASAITVRDPLSLVELHAAGLWAPVPELTADPAVCLAPPAPMRQGDAPRRVGFVARAWLRLGEAWTTSGADRFDRYVNWLAAGADHAIERWDAEPLFLPLQRRYDDDRAVAERIIARMRHGTRARIADDLTDYRALQATIGGLDALVSTRLHPLILAGVADVPPIGIAISPKVRAFLDALGLADLALSPWIARTADLAAALDRALGAPDPIRARLTVGMAAQAEAAARNPAVAASLLRGAGAAVAGLARGAGR